MPDADVELALGLVELWNSGGRGAEAIAPYCDPDVELSSPFSSVVGEPYRGYAGVEKWADDIDEQFSRWNIRVEETRSAGDRVVVIGTIEARGRVSELTMSFPAASVLDFGHDRRINRIHIYTDLNEALASVGLGE